MCSDDLTNAFSRPPQYVVDRGRHIFEVEAIRSWKPSQFVIAKERIHLLEVPGIVTLIVSYHTLFVMF